MAHRNWPCPIKKGIFRKKVFPKRRIEAVILALLIQCFVLGGCAGDNHIRDESAAPQGMEIQNKGDESAAQDAEIPDEQLRALRGRCIQDVKKTSGSISLDDAVRYQRGSL